MSEKEDRAALERAVAGGLRSAINDHGAITRAGIGSAVKRIVGNLKNAAAPPALAASADTTSAAAAALGRKGGRAGIGASKRRGSKAHYQQLAASRWAGMTAEQRSAEMKRRRRKGLKKKATPK